MITWISARMSQALGYFRKQPRRKPLDLLRLPELSSEPPVRVDFVCPGGTVTGLFPMFHFDHKSHGACPVFDALAGIETCHEGEYFVIFDVFMRKWYLYRIWNETLAAFPLENEQGTLTLREELYEFPV